MNKQANILLSGLLNQNYRKRLCPAFGGTAEELLPGMQKEEKIYKEGIVEEALPSTLFRIKLDDGEDILGHLAGKLRVNFIRILPGDRVRVEISPYDVKKGRIVHRLK